MTKTVRLIENTIVEIFDMDKDELKGKFPGVFIDTLVDAPDEVQLGWSQTGETFAAPPLPSAPDLSTTQANQIEAAFVYMNNLLETVAAANVAVSNTYHRFGCDHTSRENITGINCAIASGVPIPNPRTWMPKGEYLPINVSYIDLATIGGATLAKVDEYFQVYFFHKGSIMAAKDANTVLAYDFTAGYDTF